VISPLWIALRRSSSTSELGSPTSYFCTAISISCGPVRRVEIGPDGVNVVSRVDPQFHRQFHPRG
jgi:hypothetical protein